MTSFRPLAATRIAAAGIVAAALLTGCGGADATTADATTAGNTTAAGAVGTASTAVSQDTTVIDVRTPEEFAAGHLEGAVNLDASAADFADRINDLDPAGDYIVYCRTGNRSAAAAAVMVDAGFTSVRDAGGYEQAAADLGLPIVTT